MERTYYMRGDSKDPAAFHRLSEQLNLMDAEHQTHGNKFFCLAVAPSFFAPVVQQLGLCGLTQQDHGSWSRAIIEKPFGHDLESDQELKPRDQGSA